MHFMKKLVLVSVAIFSFTFFVHAQRTHFGVKAGWNLSSASVEEGDDYDSKSGFHAGALAHIHVSKHFAVQPEIYYSTQGGEQGDFKLKLNYINIPVLGQYMFSNGFRLQTGPQLGIRTTAKSKVGDIEADRDDQFSEIDFAWVLGASYLFPEGIGIDARYNLGLANVWENEATNTIKNRVFQLGLFYQFKHGKTKK
jgi:hypothetical protein